MIPGAPEMSTRRILRTHGAACRIREIKVYGHRSPPSGAGVPGALGAIFPIYLTRTGGAHWIVYDHPGTSIQCRRSCLSGCNGKQEPKHTQTHRYTDTPSTPLLSLLILAFPQKPRCARSAQGDNGVLSPIRGAVWPLVLWVRVSTKHDPGTYQLARYPLPRTLGDPLRYPGRYVSEALERFARLELLYACCSRRSS